MRWASIPSLGHCFVLSCESVRASGEANLSVKGPQCPIFFLPPLCPFLFLDIFNLLFKDGPSWKDSASGKLYAKPGSAGLDGPGLEEEGIGFGKGLMAFGSPERLHRG